jgi:hypothetical protein
VKLKQTIATSTSAAVIALLPVGCAHVTVDPIKVKTIHIVHDINIKVDRELDDFFAYQERGGGATTTPATTASATTSPATTTTAPATTAPAATRPATTTPAATRPVDTSGGAR